VTLKNISSPMTIYCVQLPWVMEKNIEVVSKRESLQSSKRKLLKYAVPLAVLLVLVILSVLNVINIKIEDSEIQTRIAVLPFLNIGGDSSDEYFADGMTEQIISSLSNLSGLNVIARSSVMKYKDAGIDIREIGDELNVGTVLEGSIRKSMDKARITVNLIDVSTQENIWAMDYDKELSDIFMVQSEIAKNIAQNLQVKLKKEERDRLDKKNIVNTEAYNAYLLGRSYLNRRNIDGVAKSISYFEDAISYDSTFSLAYSGLADAYTLIGSAGYGMMPVDEAVEKAKFNVMKAIELDEYLAEARASLAYIKFRLEWKFDEAEQEFKRAIELGPSYAQAHEWYALYLALRGRTAEALNEMQRAQELNPLSASVSNGIGRVYYFMNDLKKAINQFNKTLQMDPNYAEAHFSLGMTYSAMKENDKAIREMEIAASLSNRRLVIISRMAYTYVKKGAMDKALQIINELDERSKTEEVSSFYYIPYYAALNDVKKVNELLEEAYKEKFGLLLYLKADHVFVELRNTPKFLEMLKKIGL
ncbi:MAG: tetratricopeptide repeat protein, partial [Ignavibacteriales bacterium]